ncbi:MAG: efflux RND transporter periplasmic adaptor subunit [Desulfobulbus sp.]|nr:efflux RND transporter periplasmic adaptor subunit [Desulfobulbus sp.]
MNKISAIQSLPLFFTQNRRLAWINTAKAAPIILLFLLLLAGCSQEKKEEKKGGKNRAAIPVSTVLSTTQTIPVEITATGHVEALNTVEIRSQVTGVLQTVHFVEGRQIKSGDLLFSIDPRPFAADVAKTEALLAKDRADLENARRDLARYKPAAAKGLVSEEQADQALTKVATLSAAIKADQAAVESAKLSLGFCSIRAPFTGRTGELLSDQGNLIKANADNPMVTINSTDPILVSFTLPGRYLQSIRTYQKQQPIRVFAEQNAPQQSVSGQLVFINNTIDPSTGVIRLKAKFANEEQSLWPGQLIGVRLHLTDKNDALVVPSQAVQVGQQGSYLFVIRPDQSAEYRGVTLGMQYRQYTVIERGLKVGEKVVTDGQMLLENGSKVTERAPITGNQESKQP